MSGPPPPVVDAADLIAADLDRSLHRKRRHFAPALVLMAVVVGGSFVALETRPDLLEQPPAQLALQIGLWGLCLFVFPAIGVGLMFPRKSTRIGLATVAILASVAATTGWPFAGAELGDHAHASGGCLALTLGTGILLLGIGFLSGAFVQRRRFGSVFWIAAGLALVALNVVTWHCPASGLLHIASGHLGGAALLLGLAVLVGVAARRAVGPRG